MLLVLYQTLDTVFHHISNTEKRVENTTRSGVFLTIFEVFDAYCDETRPVTSVCYVLK